MYVYQFLPEIDEKNAHQFSGHFSDELVLA